MIDQSGEYITPQFIIGAGAGGCGLSRLATLLNCQADSAVSLCAPPLIPWETKLTPCSVSERIELFRRQRPHRIIGDVSHSYLPYLESACLQNPMLKVILMSRDHEKATTAIEEWTDATTNLPTNHWNSHPEPPWHYHPIWSPTFPKIDGQLSRRQSIQMYLEICDKLQSSIAKQFPDRTRVFDCDAVFQSRASQQELLEFCGFNPQLQHLPNLPFGGPMPPPEPSLEAISRRFSYDQADAYDPRRCIVLVPNGGTIVRQCEDGLRQLEREGYEVWRISGFAAIDQARNQIATDALLAGYDETMWIDSDIGFDPLSVQQLRRLDLPITCGIYPRKGQRALASHVVPGTRDVEFGKSGGLKEILYAGTGFLHVRRIVYQSMQNRLSLPVCNERFLRPTIPFFQPMIHSTEEGFWYQAEDYAFCNRARQCGYRIMADTRIRLWHYGEYGYSWEDAGLERPRFEAFNLNLHGIASRHRNRIDDTPT